MEFTYNSHLHLLQREQEEYDALRLGPSASPRRRLGFASKDLKEMKIAEA
jgi:hypothetical protein